MPRRKKTPAIEREVHVLARPFNPDGAAAITVVSAVPFKVGDAVYSDTHNDTIRSVVLSVNDDGTLTVMPKAMMKSQTAANGVPFTRHSSNFRAK